MDTTDFIFKGTANKINKASYTWKAPSNIALVKYWGKSNHQLPKNASISFTLDNCHTITTIDFIKSTRSDIEFDFYFEGKEKSEFKPKIKIFFDRILLYCPYLKQYKMVIHSKNSFPHSSGIASSASGMAAIALCLMSLEKELTNTITQSYFNQKASFLARLGSGSASRSIEGDLVVWGEHKDITNSSDLNALKYPYKIDPIFKKYNDTILLVDVDKKQVSSTIGHDLMHNNPFAKNRFNQANENLSKLSEALVSGDIKSFIEIVESEALSLHAMMMTSLPYFILIKPNTLQIIEEIWRYRTENNSNICFTLDAGANVHVLYPENEKKTVQDFIKVNLSKYCQNKKFIHDTSGDGATKLE